MFIRADATVDVVEGVEVNGKPLFEVTVTCPDRPEWKENYTLTAVDDSKAALQAIDQFVEKYQAME